MSSIGVSEIAIIVAIVFCGVLIVAGVGVGGYFLGRSAAEKSRTPGSDRE